MKILIVDDDPSQRMYLRRVLEKYFSAEVSEAKNGVEGLQMLKDHHPDLAILDIMMPLMDGYELLMRIRNNEMLKDTPVIILSANQDVDLIKKIAVFGVIDYLLKPLGIEQIKSRLSKFIAQSSLSEPQNTQSIL